MECHLDVELFLEGRLDGRWIAPITSSYCTRCSSTPQSKGQKEAEHMICWGCRHGLWKLDPKVDISTVQLVGPQTSREEFKSLYYEVYKLQRLLRSPPREPELVAEVLSSLEDHLGWKGVKCHGWQENPIQTDVWPLRSRTPRRGKRDASMERSLTEAREAHQKALAMVATLEEEIEWLSCPLTRSWSESWAHFRSWDCCRWRSRGWKRRHCQGWPEDCHAPYFKYHPSQRGSGSEGNEEAPKDFNLEDPLELGPEVDCFLQGPVESSEEENMKMPSPKPPIEELEKWVA